MTLTHSSRSQTAESIQAEHRQLHDLIAEIAQTVARAPEQDAVAWRARLASRLQDLTLQLSAHFAAEENGLFEEIVEAAPESAPVCERLLAEHGALLHRLARLAAGAGADGPGAGALRGTTETLLADLRLHEERENELILDAFDTASVGAGD